MSVAFYRSRCDLYRGTVEIIGKFRCDAYVVYMRHRAAIQIRFPAQAGQTPEILILDVCTVAPAHDLQCDQIVSRLYVWSDIEFRCHLAVLAISREPSVDPNLQIGGGGSHMKEYALVFPMVRYCESAPV